MDNVRSGWQISDHFSSAAAPNELLFCGDAYDQPLSDSQVLEPRVIIRSDVRHESKAMPVNATKYHPVQEYILVLKILSS